MDEARGEGEISSSSSRYWCHACSRTVMPIMDMESVKCPNCHGGFVEEMATAAAPESANPFFSFGETAADPDRALSLWAPILLGMMTNSRASHRSRRFRRLDFEDDVNDFDDEVQNHDSRSRNGSGGRNNNNSNNNNYSELDRELESIIRRRRTSATILQLLQGMISNSENGVRNGDDDNNGDLRDDGERVILINPFNQALVLQGSYDFSNLNPLHQSSSLGSLGDYFIGPGLDLLLQHLAENDPNRYGTPPTHKDALEALPAVKVHESFPCSICLEDFEIGAEAKEMPCEHKFHGGCIVPWLELHSSCPVCRYQLPSDDSKLESLNVSRNSITNNDDVGRNNDAGGSTGEEDGAGSENGRRFSIPLPWSFGSLFSSQPSDNGGNSSSANSDSSDYATHHS